MAYGSGSNTENLSTPPHNPDRHRAIPAPWDKEYSELEAWEKECCADDDVIIYVDEVNGKDTNKGTQHKPIKTFMEFCRRLPAHWRRRARGNFAAGNYSLIGHIFFGGPIGCSSVPLEIVGTPHLETTTSVGAIAGGQVITGVFGADYTGAMLTFTSGAANGGSILIVNSTPTEITMAQPIGIIFAIVPGDTFIITRPGTVFQCGGGTTFQPGDPSPFALITSDGMFAACLNIKFSLLFSLNFTPLVFRQDTQWTMQFCEFETDPGTIGPFGPQQLLVLDKVRIIDGGEDHFVNDSNTPFCFCLLSVLFFAPTISIYVHDVNVTAANAGGLFASGVAVRTIQLALGPGSFIGFTWAYASTFTGQNDGDIGNDPASFFAGGLKPYIDGSSFIGLGAQFLNTSHSGSLSALEIKNCFGDAVVLDRSRVRLLGISGSNNGGVGIQDVLLSDLVLNAGTTVTGVAGNTRIGGTIFTYAALAGAPAGFTENNGCRVQRI